jgi:hypothetical protein
MFPSYWSALEIWNDYVTYGGPKEANESRTRAVLELMEEMQRENYLKAKEEAV